MQHHFDIEIAEKYGLNEAIILNNIRFWVLHNEANGTNFHDGRFWTYNSQKAFEKLFPYMKPFTVRTALKSLEDNGLIITGNYNKSSYDRTKWYTLFDKVNMLFAQLSPICGKTQMDVKENLNSMRGKPQLDVRIATNGIEENNEPIISHHEKLHSDIYLHLQRPPKIERLANFEPIGRCKIPLN